ncbi:PAS domain S-box protein [Leptolyngbya ohadii]|uniref:PAS domain S-box protein n=1 Tax=Leptolyngbya ohadii TaxID=1962290 RepID=UPI0019D45BF7|nr:PAS domain S-box protein [Leptolyngbya ohadii]
MAQAEVSKAASAQILSSEQSEENLPVDQPGDQSVSQTAEQAMSQENQLQNNRFLALLRDIDAIVWEMDLTTWQFSFVSDRAEQILGYSTQQWLTEPTFWQDTLLHPEDRDRSICFCMSATLEGQDHEFEYRAIAADGRIVWLKDIVRVIKDSQNKPQMLRGIMLDITKEKTKEQEAEKSNRELQRERAERQDLEAAKEALRKSEERYRSLIEASSQMVWNTNAAGELYSEQAGWSTFTGQTPDEYLGWGWLDAVHPDDRAHTAQAWNHALATQTMYQVEHRLRRSDGVYREMSVRAVPVLETDGAVREWIGIHTDITERKKIEIALRDSEYRYAQILNSVQDMVYSMAPNSHLIYANQATQDYYGKTLEELRFHYTLHSETNAEVFATGQPIELAEEPNVRADGEVRFFHTIKSPIFDITGQVVEIVGVSRDITERKQEREMRDRALAEAQAAKAELQGVFAQAPASIWTTHGPTHIIQTANAVFQQFNGLGLDCLGKPVREVLPALIDQGFIDLLDQVYQSGVAHVGKEERAVFDHNGDGQVEESFWDYVYQPLFDANQQVYGIMVHAMNVTDQVRSRQEVEKKAEELLQLTRALEASNKELDQFAYIASHDLKAPLRAIANLSTWLEEDLEDSLTDDSRQQMKLLRGRVHRMEALIEGILQYSRAGRFKGKLERVNVQRLVQEMIELLSPPPEVQITIAPGMPTLLTEKIPLEQVFLNLIGNALKYGQSAQPKIEIRVREQDQFYEFAVADNGPGIAPEYQPKIWGIFQRLEARDQVEGTGIGLSVVQKTVEMRGGKVWVESQAGKGATFYFTWAKSAAPRQE